jgi:hypothetical protein
VPDHGIADEVDQPEPDSDDDEDTPARTATDQDDADSDSGSASTSGFDGDIGDPGVQRMGEWPSACLKSALRSPCRDLAEHAAERCNLASAEILLKPFARCVRLRLT